MFRGPPLCKRRLIFRIGSILSYRYFSRRQRRAAAVQRFPRSRGPPPPACDGWEAFFAEIQEKPTFLCISLVFS